MFPEAALYLWEWFRLLSLSRTSSGFSVSPLSYTDILAWSQLCDIRLERWELKMLKLLDMAYLTVQHEAQRQDEDGK